MIEIMPTPTNHRPDFKKIPEGGLKGIVRIDWEEKLGDLNALFDDILAKPGKVLRRGGGQGLTSMKDLAGKKCFCKVYFPSNFHRRLRDLLGFHRVLREWEATVRAQEVGVQAASIILAVSRISNFSVLGLLVTEPAPGRDARKILKDLKDDPSHRKNILENLGRYVASLHHAGFFHAHLHCKHIFLKENGEASLIDMENSMVAGSLSKRQLTLNLEQMVKSIKSYVPENEAEIFLSAYSNNDPMKTGFISKP